LIAGYAILPADRRVDQNRRKFNDTNPDGVFGRHRKLAPEELSTMPIGAVVVGLGFEERTLKSVERVLSRVRPAEAIAVRYKEKGRSRAILNRLHARGVRVKMVDYSEVLERGLGVPPCPLLVDVTGLAKPALFHLARTGPSL
jgi:hypothetical protein